MNQGFVSFIHLIFKKFFTLGTKIRGFSKEQGSYLVCQAVLRKARMFNMTTDRQVILTQNWPEYCILEPFNYRIWIPEVNSRSKIRHSCYFVGVLYQLQVSSPLASRTNQAYLATTSVMSYSPDCQPWCVCTLIYGCHSFAFDCFVYACNRTGLLYCTVPFHNVESDKSTLLRRSESSSFAIRTVLQRMRLSPSGRTQNVYCQLLESCSYPCHYKLIKALYNPCNLTGHCRIYHKLC